MRGLPLAVALSGLGVVMTCGPVRALAPPEPVAEVTPVSTDPALTLLQKAATTARTRSWAANQQVLSLSSGSPVVTVTAITHSPGQDADEPALFSLLATHYTFRVSSPSVYDGRPAELVEAMRTPVGPVVGRFWIDPVQGIVVCREVLDHTGALLRRTQLLGLTPSSQTPAPAAQAPPSGDRLDAVELSRLVADGWPVPESLPGDLTRYDARWAHPDVLQLAYSDGLSTLSLFVQPGETPPSSEGVVRALDGGQVWVSASDPERMVWAADGFTLTLVSDADPVLVDEAYLTLPHARHRVAQDGVAPRVWRGMSRVGSWLNPFD